MKQLDISSEYLKECFEYNSETGILTWRNRPEHHFKTKRGFLTFNSQKAGKMVGSKGSAGYLHV